MYTKIAEISTKFDNYVFYLKGTTLYIGSRLSGRTIWHKYSEPVKTAGDVWYVVGCWTSDNEKIFKAFNK